MSDVILDDTEQVTVQCNNLMVQGHDLLLDSPERRKPGASKFRRALVHDQADGLTINFAGDYQGGITLTGVAEISPLKEPGQIAGLVPELTIRGGISYEVSGLALEGHGYRRIKVSLNEELSKLQSQIAALTAKVAALEGHP